MSEKSSLERWQSMSDAQKAESCLEAFLGPEGYLNHLLRMKSLELQHRSSLVATAVSKCIPKTQDEDILEFDVKRETQILEDMGLVRTFWNFDKYKQWPGR